MQNFGQIHETFKDILANGIADGNGEYKKLFKSYTKALKENSVLRTQFNVFDTIENKVITPNEIEKSKLFIDECISILQELDKSKVNESNKKLVNYLTKKGFTLVADYENKDLHEHIHKLGFLKKTASNINSIVESKLFLNSHSKPIQEATIKKVVEPYMNKFMGPAMIEKFNSKYMSKLSETEKKAFKIICNGTEEEKESLYKGTLLECVDLINNKLNEESSIDEKDTFLRVKDKLLRYSYSSDKFISEISEISYLKETLI
jgi:hypothetical protein|tara:strand:- start:5148 stop:5933 length:786 start_codon:yes stop_codon:yes gene_type:complete